MGEIIKLECVNCDKALVSRNGDKSLCWPVVRLVMDKLPDCNIDTTSEMRPDAVVANQFVRHSEIVGPAGQLCLQVLKNIKV